MDAALTADPTSDYEKLAFFLADVNTESKAGVNSDAGSMEINDATNILTYYAMNGASMNPQWQEIIPSLTTLAGSLWEYKANNA